MVSGREWTQEPVPNTNPRQRILGYAIWVADSFCMICLSAYVIYYHKGGFNLFSAVVGLIPIVLLAFRSQVSRFLLPIVAGCCCQLSYSICDVATDPAGYLHFAHEVFFPLFMLYTILRAVLLSGLEILAKK